MADEETWSIRYLVVDTRNWWPGKKVLVSPRWIESIRWEESKVHVDLSRETIRGGPEYDESIPVTRENESKLFDYYGRSGYWFERTDFDEHRKATCIETGRASSL